MLIHNAGGDRNFFTYQVKTLKKHGNILLLDLPGHGNSPAMDKNSITDSSNIIYEICKELNLSNICLIGLNNGANIALNIFSQNDLPINSMILIDPPLFMNEKFVKEINEFIGILIGGYLEDFINSLVNNLFIKTDEINKNIALNSFMSSDKNSLQEMFKSLIEWDKNSENVLKNIRCQTLCILTDEHHCSYNKLKGIAPSFEIGKVIGSKCWATLEVPEQINAMIERFLDIGIKKAV